MAVRSRRRDRRSSRVRDVLGGKLFGGPRRTAREFVTVVGLVFGLVAVLILQTWQRVEMIETMNENTRLKAERSRLNDLVICRETVLDGSLSRDRIVSRASMELGLRAPEWGDVVFVGDRPTSEPAGGAERMSGPSPGREPR